MTQLCKPVAHRKPTVALYASEVGGLHPGQKIVAAFGGEAVKELPQTRHAYIAIVGPGLTWAAARAEALGLGRILGGTWDLATITSDVEQALVNANLGPRAPRSEFWLGGSQPDGEAGRDVNWHWVTGEAWNYENWSPGEPNDNFGPASEQKLAEWGAGTWNDEGNIGNITGFIAEGDIPVK
jgi:hypothetical protein